ncbi:MAG: hypothetical protein ACRELY_06610 [Polyangiaceae bacterium]
MLLAMITGLARPAGKYFYCDAMGVLPYDPCVSGSHDGEAWDLGSEARAQHHDCCEVLTVSATPAGERAQSHDVPPASLTATLPSPLASRVRVVSAGRSQVSALEKWRLPRPPPSEARTQLMVFLT